MPLGEVLRNACALVRAGNLNDGIDALERVRRRESELNEPQRALLIGTLLECRLARGDRAGGAQAWTIIEGTALTAGSYALARVKQRRTGPPRC